MHEECPNETFVYTLKFVILDGDRKLEFKGDTCRSISSAQESAAMKVVLFLGKLSIIIIMGLFFYIRVRDRYYSIRVLLIKTLNPS